MNSLRLHFEKLLENIQPPKHRLDAAATLPPKVRTYLEKHQEFPTVYPHSRLVGSYQQHLTVGDVKDVDFLVRVDGDPLANEPEAKQLIRSLKTALDDLPGGLELAGYTEIEVTGARRSVHVCFPYEDFHLDVVPCIAPDGFSAPIRVPDKGFNEWIESHPLGVIDLVTQLESANPGKFRNLGRLFKHFRNVQMVRGKPKSYWLLTLLIDSFRNEKFNASAPLGESFANLLNHLYRVLAPTYGRTDGATPNLKDPMLEHNVSWNWGRPSFVSFMLRLDEGRKNAEQALTALEADDVTEAIRRWKLVFGDEYFPADVTDLARSQAAMRQPGFAAVTSTGLVLPTATSRHHLQVPSTKYFGDSDE